MALQLSEGLSSEYIKNRKTEDGDVDEETAKFDADRQVNSKYFVNQILQQGEEGLRDAWSKVSHKQGGDSDKLTVVLLPCPVSDALTSRCLSALLS